MPQAGKDTRIIVGGYDLSSFLRNSKFTEGAKTVPVETYGANFESPFATLKNGLATLEGNFEGGVAEIDERLKVGAGANDVIVSVQFGDVLGNPGRGLKCCGTAYDLSDPVDGIVSLSAAFASVVGLERVLTHHPLGAETVAGNGGVVDNLVQSTSGGVGYLQVTAFTGTDCTVKLQDSANNSTYAD